jgi:predicted nucleotidyltransferase
VNIPAEQPTGLPPHVVANLNGIFEQWPQIKRVVLYGSRAMGTYRTGSDIDLCVEGEDLDLGDLLKIDTAIDDLLLPWKVDLSLRHTIENPAMLAHIERVGVPIYPTP